MPTPGSDSEILLRLLEHFERKHGRAGGEVVDTRVVVVVAMKLPFV